MKYWSKLVPGVTAEVLSDKEDSQGLVPAYVSDHEHGVIATGILLSEWSDTELVPAPHSVPERGFVVLSGDVNSPEYTFYAKERDAAVHAYKWKDSLGYIPVSFQRNAMVAVSRS